MELQTATAAVSSGRATLGGPQARVAPVPLSASQIEERVAFYSAERRAALLAEYRRALPRHMPRAARADALARFDAQLQALADPAWVGVGMGARYTVVQDGDEWSFRKLTPQGEVEIVRLPLADLTNCQAALVTFLVATFELLWGLFGLVVNNSAAVRFFALRVGERGAETAMLAILRLPLSAASVLKLIAILFDFGWVTAAVVLVVNGMTWWDWVTLTARIASMILPYPTFQKAYALAQIAIGLFELAVAVAAVQKECLAGPAERCCGS
jgi:hypothetical protein